MNLTNNSYYKVCFWYIRIVGLWPYNTALQKFFFHLVFYAVCFIFYVPMAIKWIKVWGKDIRIMIENSLVLLFGLGIAIKYSWGHKYCNKYKILFSKINEDWQIYKDENEHRILAETNEEGRFYASICILYSSSMLFIFALIPFAPLVLDILYPLSNGTYPLIMPCKLDYVFFDQNDYHYLCCCQTVFMAVLSASIYIGLESLYLLTIKHACGLFAISCYRIQKMNELLEDDKYKNNYFKLKSVITKQLKSAVDCHIQCINRVSLLEQTFCTPFLLTIPICVIQIPLTSIFITQVLDQFDLLIRGLMYLIGALLYLSFVNIVAQQIINSSEKFFDSAFNSNWYLMPPRTRYLILVIMMRSAKPCSITAGKLICLSAESLARILKATMSYFTLFLSMIEV